MDQQLVVQATCSIAAGVLQQDSINLGQTHGTCHGCLAAKIIHAGIAVQIIRQRALSIWLQG
jgi:hypothetical protein